MNKNENSLSERFAEHAAAAYKRMGLSDEDYWLQQLGRWMFLDRDAILAAIRTAESPDPRDATIIRLTPAPDRQDEALRAIDDGGPAFPFLEKYDALGNLYAEARTGMTLRDWFAGQALTAFGVWLPPKKAGEIEQETRARYAYEMADAMLKARAALAKARLTRERDERDEALRAALQKAYVALMNAHCVIESHLGDLEDDPKSNPEYVAVIRKEEANAKAALASIAAAKIKGGDNAT